MKPRRSHRPSQYEQFCTVFARAISQTVGHRTFLSRGCCIALCVLPIIGGFQRRRTGRRGSLGNKPADFMRAAMESESYELPGAPHAAHTLVFPPKASRSKTSTMPARSPKRLWTRSASLCWFSIRTCGWSPPTALSTGRSRWTVRTFTAGRSTASAEGSGIFPELRLLLEDVGPRHAAMEAYEVEWDFPIIGRRTMLLNAREVFNQRNTEKLDSAGDRRRHQRCAAERRTTELLQQKETLLQGMQHRVANSLQIIASILLLKARTVESEETRLHLRDAHDRVMSVATVQQQLQGSAHGEAIELGPIYPGCARPLRPP